MQMTLTDEPIVVESGNAPSDLREGAHCLPVRGVRAGREFAVQAGSRTKFPWPSNSTAIRAR
jgi:hypothetical protein